MQTTCCPEISDSAWSTPRVDDRTFPGGHSRSAVLDKQSGEAGEVPPVAAIIAVNHGTDMLSWVALVTYASTAPAPDRRASACTTPPAEGCPRTASLLPPTTMAYVSDLRWATQS